MAICRAVVGRGYAERRDEVGDGLGGVGYGPGYGYESLMEGGYGERQGIEW